METSARPLYLDAFERLTVTRNGPSLTVKDKAGRQQWYPLSRLSRIVSRGQVDWAPEALMVCLEKGIGILLLNKDGEAMALCTPARATALTLGDHIETAMASPRWSEHFENWRCSQERRLIKLLCTSIGMSCSGQNPQRIWMQLMDILKDKQGQLAVERMSMLNSPLTAQLQEILGHAGISPLFCQGWQGNTCLIEELERLMRWPLCGRIIAGSMPLPKVARGAWPYYEYILAKKLAPTMRRLVSYLGKIPW